MAPSSVISCEFSHLICACHDLLTFLLVRRFERCGITTFITRIRRWLNEQSSCDYEFGTTMHSMVNNNLFYLDVHNYIRREFPPFEMAYNVANMLFIPSFIAIKEAILDYYCPSNIAALKTFFLSVTEIGTPSWLTLFKQLHVSIMYVCVNFCAHFLIWFARI